MASPPTVRGLLALLRRNPDYRRLFFATLVSMLGDWFAFVAISGFVTEDTGHLSASAAVYAASVLPASLLSPFAGILADRMDRQRLMIAVDLARVLPALGLLAALSTRSAALALVCVALLAGLSAFFDPVAEASVPNVVSAEELPLAQAALGSVWGSMLFVGAALGGLATLAFGREVSILLNAATFLLSAGLLSGIRRSFQRAPAPAAPDETHGGVPVDPWRQFGEVWTLARHRPVTLALLTTKVGVGLGNGLVGLLPAFAAKNFGAGDEGVGLLLSARGLGALIGPFLGQAWARRDDRRLLLACGISMLTYGLAYLLLPEAPSLWAAAGCVLLAHLGGGAQWTLSTYGLQVSTPDRLRGRIMGLDFGLATLGVGVSALVASGAAELVGLTLAAWGLASASLLYGTAWLWSTRTLWRGPPDVLTAARPEE